MTTEIPPLLACMAGFKLQPEQLMLILLVLAGWGAIFIIAPINLYLSLVPPKGVPNAQKYRATHLVVCGIGWRRRATCSSGHGIHRSTPLLLSR